MGKEPVFFIFTYLMYYLTNGNVAIYLIISTVLAYTFFFTAIYKFFMIYTNNNSIIVFAILLAAFFPQLFSLSAHLNRQFIAASILLYALVMKLFYNKNIWLFQLIAILTHSTTLLFVPLLYFKPLQKKLAN